MENRKRIIELLETVRYTTNDIEKVADEICSLFNVSQQRKLLVDFTIDLFQWEHEDTKAEQKIVDRFISRITK